MLDTANPPSSTSSRCLRLTARVALTSGMAHTEEASAYTPTSMPMRDAPTPRPSLICGSTPDGSSSDSRPTKVTLAIRPNTNHCGARSGAVTGACGMLQPGQAGCCNPSGELRGVGGRARRTHAAAAVHSPALRRCRRAPLLATTWFPLAACSPEPRCGGYAQRIESRPTFPPGHHLHPDEALAPGPVAVRPRRLLARAVLRHHRPALPGGGTRTLRGGYPRPPARAQPHRHRARDRLVQPGRARRRGDDGSRHAPGHALDPEGDDGGVPEEGHRDDACDRHAGPRDRSPRCGLRSAGRRGGPRSGGIARLPREDRDVGFPEGRKIRPRCRGRLAGHQPAPLHPVLNDAAPGWPSRSDISDTKHSLPPAPTKLTDWPLERYRPFATLRPSDVRLTRTPLLPTLARPITAPGARSMLELLARVKS